jgi:hypothetical protein
MGLNPASSEAEFESIQTLYESLNRFMSLGAAITLTGCRLVNPAHCEKKNVLRKEKCAGREKKNG